MLALLEVIHCKSLQGFAVNYIHLCLHGAVKAIKAGGKSCMKRNFQTVPFGRYLLFQSKFSQKSKSLMQTWWLICSQGRIWGHYPRSLYLKIPLLEIYLFNLYFESLPVNRKTVENVRKYSFPGATTAKRHMLLAQNTEINVSQLWSLGVQGPGMAELVPLRTVRESALGPLLASVVTDNLCCSLDCKSITPL